MGVGGVGVLGLEVVSGVGFKLEEGAGGRGGSERGVGGRGREGGDEEGGIESGGMGGLRSG